MNSSAAMLTLPELNDRMWKQAETCYMHGDFEEALVLYNRGVRIRPKAEQFRRGIIKCEEAILSESRKVLQSKAKLPQRNLYGSENSTGKLNRPRRLYLEKLQIPADASQKSDQIHLRYLQRTGRYLRKFLREVDQSKNNGLKSITYDTLGFLRQQSHFWRTQLPEIAIDDLPAKDATSTRYHIALQQLLLIKSEFDCRNFASCLTLCQTYMRVVAAFGEKNFREKYDVIAKLYSIQGNAYIELNQPKSALRCHKRDLKISQERSLRTAEARAMKNIGRTYVRMRQYDDAIRIWRKRLAHCESDNEHMWLNHEIGYCYLMKGDSAHAQFYAHKAFTCTATMDWRLNADTLLAQAQVLGGSTEDAMCTLRRALMTATGKDDTAAVIGIRQAIQDLGSSQTDHRETSIKEENHCDA